MSKHRTSIDRLPSSFMPKYGVRLFTAQGEALKFVGLSTSTPGSIFVLPLVEGSDHHDMRVLPSAQLFAEVPRSELAAAAVKPAAPAVNSAPPRIQQALPAPPASVAAAMPKPGAAVVRAVVRRDATVPTPAAVDDYAAQRNQAVAAAHRLAQGIAKTQAEAAAQGRRITPTQALDILRKRGQVPAAPGSH